MPPENKSLIRACLETVLAERHEGWHQLTASEQRDLLDKAVEAEAISAIERVDDPENGSFGGRDENGEPIYEVPELELSAPDIVALMKVIDLAITRFYEDRNQEGCPGGTLSALIGLIGIMVEVTPPDIRKSLAKDMMRVVAHSAGCEPSAFELELMQ
jgi:hypothetical protein